MSFIPLLIQTDTCLFFKQKTAYEMRISDWSADVCSSDLLIRFGEVAAQALRDIAQLGRQDRRCLVGLSTARWRVGAHGVEADEAGEGEGVRHEPRCTPVLAPERSEERRVGKEGARPRRSRRSPERIKKTKKQ